MVRHTLRLATCGVGAALLAATAIAHPGHSHEHTSHGVLEMPGVFETASSAWPFFILAGLAIGVGVYLTRKMRQKD